jgi:hypothetical protein
MPVSMSMSASGLSPSQRQSTDEARMRARSTRYGDQPGPGHYDPRRDHSTAEDVCGSFAFKSKSERKNDVSLSGMGDPGSYDPYNSHTVAHQSARSFNKSASTGASGFGSRSKRAELSTTVDSPGPGTYDAKTPSSPEAKQGSSFASQTKRGAYLSKAITPGAGEYDPDDKEKVKGGESMFKSKDQRFKKSIEVEYAAHVAPGSYSQDHHTVAKKYHANRGKVSASFASTSLRGDLWARTY